LGFVNIYNILVRCQQVFLINYFCVGAPAPSELGNGDLGHLRSYPPKQKELL